MNNLIGMEQIMEDLLKNARLLKPSVKALEEQIAAKDAVIERTKIEKKNLEIQLKDAQDKLTAIESSIEMLKEGGFNTPPVYIDGAPAKIVKAPEPVKKPIAVEKKAATKKSIVKMDAKGTIMEKFKSQLDAGRKLGMSGANVAYWLKKTKETQLKKRGFYLAYC